MMNSLWWQQWHEHKRYLAIFIVGMLLAACYCIGYEMGHRYRAVVGSFSSVASLYTVCAAVFLAMRTTQGERTAGTLAFSVSLPVSMRRIATARIGAAIATLAIPMLVASALLSFALASELVEQAAPRAAGAAYIQLPQRDAAALFTTLEQLWSVAAIAVFGGVELLLVLCLLGCWLRNESQVGLLGAVLGFGATIASGLFWLGTRSPYGQLIYGVFFPQSLVVHWGYGEVDGGYTDHELIQYRWLALGLAVPVLVIIGRLFVIQYGSMPTAAAVAKPLLARFAIPTVLSYIPFRWPGRLSALIWLELRQSVPLVSFGLLLALLMAGAGVMTEGVQDHSIGVSLLTRMPHSTGVVAILWAVVVGSGLYSAELGSGLGAFWRSRPISSRMWFWCKFVVGLVAVLSLLDGVTVLSSWNTPRDTMTTGMSWAYVACFPIIHSLMYALAVCGTCWLRRPVIGGLLAIFGYAVLTISITAFPLTNPFEPFNIFNTLLSAERAGRVDFTQHGYPFVYGVLAALILLLALVSSRLAQPLQPASRWFTPTGG